MCCTCAKLFVEIDVKYATIYIASQFYIYSQLLALVPGDTATFWGSVVALCHSLYTYLFSIYVWGRHYY